jgi:hypothetical protein
VTICYLAETKKPRGGYLRNFKPSWSSSLAVTLNPHLAQKFRTLEGCQAFIDEWNEAKDWEPVEHGFMTDKEVQKAII